MYSDSIKPLSVLHSGLEVSGSLFFQIFMGKKNSIFFIKQWCLCNFLVQTLQKILKSFLPTKSWKNHPQKLLRKTHIRLFFLTAWAAQTVQIEEFMFQNVAYRPTVYRTGVTAKRKLERLFNFFID